MPEILIFGAGNIGRAFIGQVFSANGWNVVFADINQNIINLLNQRGSYPVVVKQEGKADRNIIVNKVSAVSVTDKEEIYNRIVNADILATSVGKNSLSHVAPIIAEGLQRRIQDGCSPIDLILAENIHEGKKMLEIELRKYLPNDFDLRSNLGIVQTSIGKMVPLVTEEDLADNPLAVASEEYNELILDKVSFLNDVPRCTEINAVNNIEAYVDRKLFIHNLGHAAAAYIGNQKFPEEKYLANILEDSEVYNFVKAAMNESAAALMCLYPAVFSSKELLSYVEDLLRRFRNRKLGDTVFRVGRDLRRKLNVNDRILGAILNCEQAGTSWSAIGRVFIAALEFSAADETGKSLQSDIDFLLVCKSGKNFLETQCGLNCINPFEKKIIDKLKKKGFST
jgi:mannitol-1-phosphate 5-dehydrogenase